MPLRPKRAVKRGTVPGQAPKERHFVTDARILLTLGRDSIKDKATAVLELVKNSYDAGASVVDIRISAASDDEGARFIRISDNGHGMTSRQVDTQFLWVGYSDKRERPTHNGRRRIGEKGVGRISADRLGSVLELRTQAEESRAVGITINWDHFDTRQTQIDQIPIPEIRNPSFEVPSRWLYRPARKTYSSVVGKPASVTTPGTELTIRGLRQDWDLEEIEALWGDLALLTSPFGASSDFQIRLTHDLHPKEHQGVVPSELITAAEVKGQFELSAEGEVTFSFEGKDDIATGVNREKWNAFCFRDNQGPKWGLIPRVGPLKVVLYYYLRKSTETLSVTELREVLNRVSGIKVYRDGIRVMPYGDPRKLEGGDWLGLGDRKVQNPAGAARKDFRVAPNQIVGGVFISSDANPKLRDTAAREGLIHDDAFRELRAFVMGCIHRLEGHYHEVFLKRKSATSKDVNPRQAVRDFGVGLRKLREDLNAIKDVLPSKTEKKVDGLTEQINETVTQLTAMKQTIDELASQATIYRGLASVGISSVVFSHETDSSLEQFLSSVLAARNVLKFRFTLDKLPTALDQLAMAIAEAKKISTWGRFALRRVKADKRRKRQVDLGELIKGLAADLNTAFAASTIEFKCDVAACEGRAFQMDIESVVLNLLTNAYSFAKHTADGPRRVCLFARAKLQGGRKGIQIRVSDSGPGVPEHLREQIWMPLFTTKADEKGRAIGTGLGLAIVDDIVKDNDGTRIVDVDPILGGARFTIWIPLP